VLEPPRVSGDSAAVFIRSLQRFASAFREYSLNGFRNRTQQDKHGSLVAVATADALRSNFRFDSGCGKSRQNRARACQQTPKRVPERSAPRRSAVLIVNPSELHTRCILLKSKHFYRKTPSITCPHVWMKPRFPPNRFTGESALQAISRLIGFYVAAGQKTKADRRSLMQQSSSGG
jgi:hypothetical protein